MPLPLPKKGEEKKHYIARFMSSAVAQKEFPKQKRRLAVAFSKWRKK